MSESNTIYTAYASRVMPSSTIVFCFKLAENRDRWLELKPPNGGEMYSPELTLRPPQHVAERIRDGFWRESKVENTVVIWHDGESILDAIYTSA